MKATYEGDWKNYKDMKASVEYKGLPPASAIVYACYQGGGYDGEAIIVWKDGRFWFENSDSHCSCNGLENWSPEATTAKALLMRQDHKWLGLRMAVKASMKRKRKKIALSFSGQDVAL